MASGSGPDTSGYFENASSPAVFGMASASEWNVPSPTPYATSTSSQPEHRDAPTRKSRCPSPLTSMSIGPRTSVAPAGNVIDLGGEDAEYVLYMNPPLP